MKEKIILLSVLAVLLLALLAAVIGYIILSLKDNKPSRPAHVEKFNGFVRAEGRNLYDGAGNLLLLKGVNLGNWFDQENYMTLSGVGDFETGVYTAKRAEAAMKQNPNLTPAQIEELKALYIDEYIKESDFAEIASLGLNCVRINFTYVNMTTDGYTIRQDAFDKLDEAVGWAEKYGLYVILDYHGAVGSQNQDFHSGVDDTFDLYGNRKNMDATIDLWKAIAGHYADNKTVAIYDLLNEPRSAPGRFAGKAQFDFYDELYQAVRSIDRNHVIMMECFTFPTHGVSEKNYEWENIAYSYHFYNHTPFSQKFALNFYKVLDNLMGYQVPIVVGEFNPWYSRQGWADSFTFFEEQGWSYLAWTYKANRYHFDAIPNGKMRLWGFYEFNVEPVDLSTATYEEIRAAYLKVSTSYAEKTMIYEIYEKKNK